MKIVTNSIFDNLEFSRNITKNSEWCEEAKIVTAFFTDDSLISIMNNNDVNVTLVVSLRPPTSYEALLRVSALKNVDVRFLGKELHSKIYAFKKGTQFKCSIGSSNLTRGGIYENIETNVLLENEDAEKCYSHIERIINRSYSLTASILDEYKDVYQSFEEHDFKSIKPPQTSFDTGYNKLWFAVDLISDLVSDELSEYFPSIPKYLVIDHFWHFIVKIKEDFHDVISEKMRGDSNELYLVELFKSFVNWDFENGEPTKGIFQRSLKFRKLLLSKKNLTDEEILTVFKTLHSTRSRTLRFAHDVKFLEENPRANILVSMRHLVDENIDLNERIEDLSKPEYALKLFGTSAIGEFNGWCYPEKYPIRNKKADKALEILGYW